jgi:hypothetical protein
MSELGRDSRELVDAARAGDDPSPEDRARIRQRLLQLGVGAAVTTAASATAAASAATSAAAKGTMASGTLVLKWVLAVAVVGGMGAAGAKGIAAYRARQAETVQPQVASRGMAPARAAPLPAAPLVTIPETTPELTAPEVTPASDPVAIAKPARAPVNAVPVVAPMQPSTRAESTTELESRLLSDAEARRHAGDASGALALLDEHARRFPNGVLAEERAAERVFALCDLGRVVEATAEARQFLAERPRSIYAKPVRASCARAAAP